MKRTNIYLSDSQREKLAAKSQNEGVPVAELVRRALDAYLTWDDPAYRSEERKRSPRTKNTSC